MRLPELLALCCKRALRQGPAPWRINEPTVSTIEIPAKERISLIAFGDAAASLTSDLDQQHMDVAPLHVRAAELETAAKYAICALVTLIAALRDAIDALCDCAWAVDRAARAGAAEVPAMKEFFQFAWAVGWRP
ncbi:MAG: hypothetical protein R3E87_02340 [Burkholderiaceae bacterium]